MTYDADSLLEFILSSGDLRDPLTRKVLNERELNGLRKRCVPATSLPSPASLERKHLAEVARRDVQSFMVDELVNELFILYPALHPYELPMYITLSPNVAALLNTLKLISTPGEFAHLATVCKERFDLEISS